MLTRKIILAVTKGIAQDPLLKKFFLEGKAMADETIKNPIQVSVPDNDGGFTPEQHKQNCQYILACDKQVFNKNSKALSI